MATVGDEYDVRCSCGRRFSNILIETFLDSLAMDQDVDISCPCGIVVDVEDANRQVIAGFIEEVVRRDVAYLTGRFVVRCPPLSRRDRSKEKRVKMVDRHAKESYWDVETILQHGRACPEDLVAWRCAELRVAGVDASIVLRGSGNTRAIGVRYEDAGEIMEEWYR